MSLVTIESIKKTFKNLTNGTKHITTTITNQPINIPFRNEEIELLLKQHPNKEKITDIEYLVVKIRPPYNKKSLYVKNITDDDEQDVSYKYCLKSLYGKYSKENNNRDRIIRAFRDTIGNSKKRKFFLETDYNIDDNGNYIGICENCKKTDKIHIDHYMHSFQQILDDFIQKQSITFSKLEVYENNNLYEFTDKKIAEDWINFHDEKAEYRVLCPSCNISLSSYGYKKTINLYK